MKRVVIDINDAIDSSKIPIISSPSIEFGQTVLFHDSIQIVSGIHLTFIPYGHVFNSCVEIVTASFLVLLSRSEL